MSVYFPELSNFDDTEIIEKNRNKNKLNNKHSSNVVEISECNNNNYHCISNMTFPSVRSVLWNRQYIAEGMITQPLDVLPTIVFTIEDLNKFRNLSQMETHHQAVDTAIKNGVVSLCSKSEEIQAQRHGYRGNLHEFHWQFAASAFFNSDIDSKQHQLSVPICVSDHGDVFDSESTSLLIQGLHRSVLTNKVFKLKSTSRLRCGLNFHSSPSKNEYSNPTGILEIFLPNDAFQYKALSPIPIQITPFFQKLVHQSHGETLPETNCYLEAPFRHDMGLRSGLGGDADEFGYLSLNSTRKLLFLREKDPSVSLTPLVGIWIHLGDSNEGNHNKYPDQGLCEHVKSVQNEKKPSLDVNALLRNTTRHPLMWAACSKFCRSQVVKDRVLVASGTFLAVAVYKQSLFYYECTLINQKGLNSDAPYCSFECIFPLSTFNVPERNTVSSTQMQQQDAGSNLLKFNFHPVSRQSSIAMLYEAIAALQISPSTPIGNSAITAVDVKPISIPKPISISMSPERNESSQRSTTNRSVEVGDSNVTVLPGYLEGADEATPCPRDSVDVCPTPRDRDGDRDRGWRSERDDADRNSVDLKRTSDRCNLETNGIFLSQQIRIAQLEEEVAYLKQQLHQYQSESRQASNTELNDSANVGFQGVLTHPGSMEKEKAVVQAEDVPVQSVKVETNSQVRTEAEGELELEIGDMRADVQYMLSEHSLSPSLVESIERNTKRVLEMQSVAYSISEPSSICVPSIAIVNTDSPRDIELLSYQQELVEARESKMNQNTVPLQSDNSKENVTTATTSARYSTSTSRNSVLTNDQLMTVTDMNDSYCLSGSVHSSDSFSINSRRIINNRYAVDEEDTPVFESALNETVNSIDLDRTDDVNAEYESFQEPGVSYVGMCAYQRIPMSSLQYVESQTIMDLEAKYLKMMQ